jgi:hypothetical protein
MTPATKDQIDRGVRLGPYILMVVRNFWRRYQGYLFSIVFYNQVYNSYKHSLATTGKVRKKRASGFEPPTSSLGSWHSTTELRPLELPISSLLTILYTYFLTLSRPYFYPFLTPQRLLSVKVICSLCSIEVVLIFTPCRNLRCVHFYNTFLAGIAIKPATSDSFVVVIYSQYNIILRIHGGLLSAILRRKILKPTIGSIRAIMLDPPGDRLYLCHLRDLRISSRKAQSKNVYNYNPHGHL